MGWEGRWRRGQYDWEECGCKSNEKVIGRSREENRREIRSEMKREIESNRE